MLKHADGSDQASFGVVGGHVGDVLNVWPNDVVQRVQVRGEGGSERRVQSRSTPPEAKPGSLWTCGSAPSPAATPRVLSPATWLQQGITTLFSTSRYTLVLTFKSTSNIWGGTMCLSHETSPKTIIVAGNFVFITLGTSLFIVVIQIFILMVLAIVFITLSTLNCPDLHFESTSNGPVVITWIGREHGLYSGRISDLARWTLSHFQTG